MRQEMNRRRLNVLFKHETIALLPNGFNSDSSSASAILRLTCQGLLKQDFDGALVPDLATDWDESPDRLRYRFRLRPGLRFHSGRPCDAQAVAWNFQRLFNGCSDTLLAQDYQGLSTVQAVGPLEVEFLFSTPNAAFLANLAWRTFIVDDSYDQPCGTGPFRLRQWQRGSHILLSRFEQYQGASPAPEVDEVRIEFAPGVAQRVERIRKGDVDVVENVPVEAAAALEQAGLLHTALTASRHRSVMYFNCRPGLLHDPRVRRALAHGIDRQALMQAVTGGAGEVVDGMLAAADSFFVPIEPIEYDPQRARRLLSEAGVPTGATLRMVTTNTAPFPLVAEHVGRDLRALGLDVAFNGYDDPPWWPYMYMRGNWDICLQGTPARPHLDTLLVRELCAGGGFNAGGYVNPELDALARTARQSLDRQEQHDCYAQIQQLVQRDLPFFSLFAMDSVVGWRPGLEGFRTHPSGAVDLSGVRVGRGGSDAPQDGLKERGERWHA